jgi:hypothetical protein
MMKFAIALILLVGANAQAEKMVGGGKSRAPQPPARADEPEAKTPEFMQKLTSNCNPPYSSFEKRLSNLRGELKTKFEAMNPKQVTHDFAYGEHEALFVFYTYPSFYAGKDESVADKKECSDLHGKVRAKLESGSALKKEREDAINAFEQCLGAATGNSEDQYIKKSAAPLLACYRQMAKAMK